MEEADKSDEIALSIQSDESQTDYGRSALQWFISPPLFGFTLEQFALFHIRFSILTIIFGAIFVYASSVVGLRNQSELSSVLTPYIILIVILPMPFLFAAGIGIGNRSSWLIYPHIGILVLQMLYSAWLIIMNLINFTLGTRGIISLMFELAYLIYFVQVARVMVRVVYEIKTEPETTQEVLDSNQL